MIAGVPYDAEVEYLESTGKQWIDTDVSGSNTLKVFVDVEGNGIDCAVCGCGSDLYSTDRFQVYIEQYYSARIDGARINTTIPYNQRVSILVDAQNQKVFFNEQEYDCSYSSALSSKKIWLFGRNVPNSRQLSGMVYQSKIWDNGVLVRDFIPVRVGTVGYMYDRVTKKLFGNAGTGAFVLGPDVATPVMGLRRYPQSHLGKMGARHMIYGGN